MMEIIRVKYLNKNLYYTKEENTWDKDELSPEEYNIRDTGLHSDQMVQKQRVYPKQWLVKLFFISNPCSIRDKTINDKFSYFIKMIFKINPSVDQFLDETIQIMKPTYRPMSPSF